MLNFSCSLDSRSGLLLCPSSERWGVALTSVSDVGPSANRCQYCRRTGNRLFTEENSLDLGEVLQELRNLTMVEEILIARVHPVVSVYKIRGVDLQQTGYSGHVMNFNQHIERVANRLGEVVLVAFLSQMITATLQCILGILGRHVLFPVSGRDDLCTFALSYVGV